jgi:pyruvate formate lyase activating enzyme
MLKACGEKGLHRAVDTCGFASTETLLEVAKHTDLFLFDLKLMDPIQHKKWTGIDNRLILKNLKTLAETGANINIRIPFIKNVNTGVEEITGMAEFINRLPFKNRGLETLSDNKAGATPGRPLVNLLPYHNIASGKYKKLEMFYDLAAMDEPTTEELQNAAEIFEKYGIEVEIGG